jgi:hypothetical protein
MGRGKKSEAVDMAEGEFTSLFGDRRGTTACSDPFALGFGKSFERSSRAGLLFLLCFFMSSDI